MKGRYGVKASFLGLMCLVGVAAFAGGVELGNGGHKAVFDNGISFDVPQNWQARADQTAVKLVSTAQKPSVSVAISIPDPSGAESIARTAHQSTPGAKLTRVTSKMFTGFKITSVGASVHQERYVLVSKDQSAGIQLISGVANSGDKADLDRLVNSLHYNPSMKGN